MSKSSWDRMSPKVLVSTRERKLHRQFRFQLYAFSAFYRQVLDETKLGPEGMSRLSDLPKAPLVTRSILAESQNSFLLRPTRSLIQKYGATGQLISVSLEMILHGSQRSEQLVRNEYEPVHNLATAGTQGKPITINLSKRDLGSLAEQGQRTLEVAGVGRGDRLINFLPSQAAGGFWTTWLGGVSLGVEQSAPGRVGAEQAADLITLEKPAVLIGEAAFLLNALQTMPRRPSELRTVILAPHVTPGSLRTQVGEAAGPGVKVIATYGFAEGRSVWAECAEGGAGSGFHTYPDLEVFELLSVDTGRPVGPEDGGEIVFTGLEQRGTALARYRPGDIVASIGTGLCPYCGRNVERIMPPVRRVGNLVTVRTSDAPPIEIDQKVLEGVLSHPDLAGWQLEVTRLQGQSNGYDDLCLLFKPKERRDAATLAVEIDAILRRELGLSPQLVLSDRTGGGVLDLREV